MPRSKPATVSTLAPFGKLDGEKIERVYVKISGMVRLDHAPKEGEIVLLAIKGAANKMSVTHVFGTLSRIYNLNAAGNEVTGELRATIGDYLAGREDEEEGRQQLPLNDGEDDNQDPE